MQNYAKKCIYSEHKKILALKLALARQEVELFQLILKMCSSQRFEM